MVSFLIAIIYVAFISLGLPDSMLGAAWPVMHGEIGADLSYAGIITMIISVGTIISSLLSDRLTRKFSAGMVTAVSTLTTAVAIFGFSISGSFIELCLWAVPYGLGAGAIDAALNNFVALHYNSRTMSWLHCFWGLGATISPYIMGYCITGGFGWRNGYFSVSIIQVAIAALLFFSLPLWKRKAAESTDTNESDAPEKPLGISGVVKLKGIFPLLIAFFAYCAVEQTAMLWSASYLVENRGIGADAAAKFSSFFLIGITAGRFLSGIVADRLGDKTLIRIGIYTVIFGIMLVLIPMSSTIALIGLIIIGFGCAPIYPAIIHSTPDNFGKENSQAIIGIEMAAAYTGITFMPMLFGFIASITDIAVFPLYLLIITLFMLIMIERLNNIMKQKSE